MKKLFSKKTLSLFALGLGLASVSGAAFAATQCSTSNFVRVCITQNGTNQPATVFVRNLSLTNKTLVAQVTVYNCAASPGCVGRKIHTQVNYPFSTRSNVISTGPIPRGLWLTRAAIYDGGRVVAYSALESRLQ